MTMNIYVKDYLLLSLLMNFRWCNNKRMNWIEFFLWYLYLQAYTHTHTHSHSRKNTYQYTNISLYVYILPEVAAVRSSFVRSLVRSLIDDWWSWFANYNTTYNTTYIYPPHTLQNFDELSHDLLCGASGIRTFYWSFTFNSFSFRYLCPIYLHIHTLYINKY